MVTYFSNAFLLLLWIIGDEMASPLGKKNTKWGI
jgi:hypothetical protein